MDLLNKLSAKIAACIKRQNIPFILGGSRDVSYASAHAAMSQIKKKTLHIMIRSNIDNRDKPIDIITQSNSLSSMLAMSDFHQDNSILIFGARVQANVSYEGISLISLEEIRNAQVQISPHMMDPLS